MCVFSASAWRIAAAAFFFSTVLYPALAQTNVECVFGDFLADQWVAEVWDCDNPTQKMEYDLDEQQVVSTGTNAVEVRYGCLGGYGGFGFTRRAPDWSQIFWMYPNQYRSVSFDFYCADTTTAAVAGLGLSLDIAGGTLAPIVNYIDSPLRTGEWRHVQIPVSDCNPQGYRFVRIFFFNNSQRNPHVFMDNVALHWVPDAMPPVVRSVSVTNIGWTTATISFETDEYAYSRLFLGMTEPLQFALDSGDFLLSTTFHSTNLLPGTTYQFRLEVGDHQIGGAPSNTATFSGTFTTAPTNIPPVIGVVTVSGVRAESATISWSTRLPSDSTVQYGMGGYSSAVHNATFSINHVVTLTGLQPTAMYQYRVMVQDPYGNTANFQQNPPLTFQTLAPVQAGLWADAHTPIHPFSAAMRGANLVNWAIFYGRPYPNDSPKLRELTRLIKPGVLRHAGGLASNHILWDRANRATLSGGIY